MEIEFKLKDFMKGKEAFVDDLIAEANRIHNEYETYVLMFLFLSKAIEQRISLDECLKRYKVETTEYTVPDIYSDRTHVSIKAGIQKRIVKRDKPVEYEEDKMDEVLNEVIVKLANLLRIRGNETPVPESIDIPVPETKPLQREDPRVDCVAQNPACATDPCERKMIYECMKRLDMCNQTNRDDD